MRASTTSTYTKLLLVIAVVTLLAGVASAAVNGAIYTTTSTGTKVNGNLYAAKTDVYLNGGPQNTKDPGLVPDGNYYFQVTDPSGAVLLSADDISCRVVVVQNGRIIGVPGNSAYGSQPAGSPGSCTDNGSGQTTMHAVGTFNPTNNEVPVQLCPAASSRPDTLSHGSPVYDPNNMCDTTPNPGGEYKAWLTPTGNYSLDGSSCSTSSRVTFGFCDADSKTDNFKTQPTVVTCTGEQCQGPPPPETASLVACKYWDMDDDGFNEGPDTLLSGWTITASTTDPTLVINGGTPGASASGITDSTGCTTFSLTGFPDTTTVETVTLTETQQTNWNQVAPLNGSYIGGTGGSITVTGTCVADGVTGLVAPCTSTSSVPLIGDGSTTVAPDFGNTGLDLAVSKTANPGFTRTYSWNITKCAEDPNSTNCVSNPTKVDQAGGTVTFNYQVAVSETSFTDSGWQVKGAITVSNPNSFAVTNVTITENGDGIIGDTCLMDDTSAATETVTSIAANGSASRNYTCSGYSSNPGSGTNSATATWSAATFNTPDGSATGTKGYSFGSPTNPVNQTITVTDCFNGTLNTTGVCSGTSTQLGTLTATDITPYTSHTYTYTHTITVPKFGCATFPNTARIVETDQRVSASVEVCGPENTGALTMGYWQNKNGQGIISGGASTSGVCNSGTWLRQFAPFQDLSSTAKCSAVATYVYNVIKAATCGGTTCNAMLKAQMLATSLDVYFSDGSLGGNKIGAPGPIGPDLIDLTMICKMIDGSGGTGTCSGSYENVSSAFGSATQLSVLGMITVSSGYSNSGGTTWYGNVKATQTLAKDAFDAVNNQVAFAP